MLYNEGRIGYKGGRELEKFDVSVLSGAFDIAVFFIFTKQDGFLNLRREWHPREYSMTVILCKCKDK